MEWKIQSKMECLNLLKNQAQDAVQGAHGLFLQQTRPRVIPDELLLSHLRNPHSSQILLPLAAEAQL